MSNTWLNAAMDDARAKNGARLMLFVLADRADDSGVSFYGIAELARRTNLGERAAHYAISELVALKLLAVEYKRGPNGCNVYRLLSTLQNLHGAKSARCKKVRPTLQNLQSDPAISAPNPSGIPQEPSISAASAPKKAKARLTLEECHSLAKQLGLPESDGDSFFAIKEENGWKNGPNKVQNAEATFRNWHRRGFHPSQKQSVKNGTNGHGNRRSEQAVNLRDSCDPVDFTAWLRSTFSKADPNLTPHTATHEIVLQYVAQRPSN